MGFPSRTIDEILHEISVTDTTEGAHVRRILKCSTENEENEYQKAIQTAQQIAMDSRKLQNELIKKDKKVKKDSVMGDLPPTPEMLAYQNLLGERILSVELLIKLLTFRMSWEDAGFGFLFDMETSELITPSGKYVILLRRRIGRKCRGRSISSISDISSRERNDRRLM